MTILAILLKASLLLFAAIVVHVLVGRRLSAASRHLLWALAIAGLLVLPVLHGSLPAWTVVRVAPSRAPELARMAESAVSRFAPDLTSSVSAPVGAGHRPLPDVRSSWSTVASVVYGGGLLAFLLRLVAQRWSVRRLTRRAMRMTDPAWTRLLNETLRRLNLQRPIVLLRSLEETMPMACGTWRPAILLPAVADTWSEDQRRSVLLHELAHVARYDCLTQSLAAIACAIYWVHPGAWWIARRLRIERELACDDRVLAAGADPDDYASQLLEFAYSLRVETASALAVTMAAPTSLEERLRALLDLGRNRQLPARRSRVAATAIVLLLVGATATARLGEMLPLLPIQDAPRQTFDVASVKPNKSSETGGFIQRMRGGTFNVGNQTLLQLIRFAYGIQGLQLVGAPDWMATERFDIVAKASADLPAAPGQPSPEALMLRSLLEDRFRLAIHRETRPMPIYALVVARVDGRLGPQIRRPANDYCAQRAKEADKAPPPPMGTGPVCGIRGSNTELTGGDFPMAGLARFLAGEAGKPVVDRTGLTGGWDFELKWSPPDTPNPDPDRPSIFTALQEQLGLRLDATTGPLEVLVIDRVERLTPD
jgi:bla regulator protein blaR1